MTTAHREKVYGPVEWERMREFVVRRRDWSVLMIILAHFTRFYVLRTIIVYFKPPILLSCTGFFLHRMLGTSWHVVYPCVLRTFVIFVASVVFSCARAVAVISARLSTTFRYKILFISAVDFSHFCQPILYGPRCHHSFGGHHHVDIKCSQSEWNFAPRPVWLVLIYMHNAFLAFMIIDFRLLQHVYWFYCVYVHNRCRGTSSLALSPGYMHPFCSHVWLTLTDVGFSLPNITCIGLIFEF
jgi:hypothetical protein